MSLTKKKMNSVMKNRIIQIIIIPLILLILCFTKLYGEYKNLDTLVKINGVERYIGFTFPDKMTIMKDYDVIIVFHSTDENALECRDRVLGELKWDTLFTDAIFAFPDAGESMQFYKPLDNSSILDSTISIINNAFVVTKKRKIIIANGLNCRGATKYAYDHYTYFTGLILLKPQFIGINDIKNIEPTSLIYNYNSGKYINTFILNDSNNYFYSNLFERELIYPNKIVWSIIDNHSNEKYLSDSLMKIARDYAFYPDSGASDIGIYDIEIPKRICDTKIKPVVLVKHIKGKLGLFVSTYFVLGDLTFLFHYDNFYSHFRTLFFDTQLLPKDYFKFDSLESGKIKLKAYLGEKYNSDSTNDTIVRYVYFQRNSFISPQKMDFESNDTDLDKFWIVESSGDKRTWAVDSESASSGEKSLSMHNSKFQYDNAGQSEDFLTPFVDMSVLENKNITFDYAFNYQIYQGEISTDTLKIYATTDCDKTYQLIYQISGKDFATTNIPISNPMNKYDARFIPKSNEWKTKTLDLSEYGKNHRISFKFSIVSGMGGSTYLDNIRIGDFVTSVKNSENTQFKIVPNPIKNRFSIFGCDYGEHYSITDIYGKKVMEFQQDKNYIDISDLVKGTYFITNSKNHSVKIIKE